MIFIKFINKRKLVLFTVHLSILFFIFFICNTLFLGDTRFIKSDSIWDAFENTSSIVRNISNLEISNPYEGIEWSKTSQYKANFHTHSIRSDGAKTVQELIDLYATRGFTALAISDHNNYTATINETIPWNEMDMTDSKGLIPVTACEITNVQDIQSLFSRESYIPITQKGINARAENDRRQEAVDTGDILPDDLPPIVWPTTEEVLEIGQKAGAILCVNHPGRYYTVTSTYVDWYKKYDNLISMEIYNSHNNGYTDPVKIWDNVLEKLMPNKNVWGSGEDDYHNDNEETCLGSGYNLMLINDKRLNEAGIKASYIKGSFFACHNKKPISGKLPAIKSVLVNQIAGTISIKAENCISIKIISGINEIKTTMKDIINIDVKKLIEFGFLDKYIRIELENVDGIVYIQPFGLKYITN